MIKRIFDLLFLFATLTFILLLAFILVLAFHVDMSVPDLLGKIYTIETQLHHSYVAWLQSSYPHWYQLRLALESCIYLAGIWYLVKYLVINPIKHRYPVYKSWMEQGKNRLMCYVTLGLVIVFCILFLEVGLRLAGVYTPFYNVYYTDGHLHIHASNSKSKYSNKEFQYVVRTNSQGMVDREWPLQKRKPCRIACLGDSYTEGVGAPVDSSYPRQLETMQQTAEVLNFGVSGSDVLYEYKLYNEVIAAYNPDAVVIAINRSDIDDIRYRGGFDRFGIDGETHTAPAPWWNTLCDWSCIMRVFVHAYDPYFARCYQHPHEVARNKMRSLAAMKQAVDSIAAACRVHSTPMVFVFHPTMLEIKADRMECEEVMIYARMKGYPVIDVLQALRESGIGTAGAARYFWPIDGHCNSAGYHFMARVVRDSLLSPDGQCMR